MIKMISVKCPDCGAALEFEEGRRTAFCSYCGAKIILNNENEFIYRNIDEAEIRQAENDRIYMLKEMEMEEKAAKHRRVLTFIWLIATALLFITGTLMVVNDPAKDSDGPGYMLLLFAMMVGIGGGSSLLIGRSEKKRNRNRPGYLKVPEQLSDYENMHYSAVVSTLRAAGFSNIRTINLGDLRLGLLKKNGSVDSVTIGGEAFSAGNWYPKEAQLVVSYHGFPK